MLEREPPQNFDVLAIDAFSSDAIPGAPHHLRGARRSTCKHMKPDGVIAFHVTNRFLDLVPVVEALAHEHDLHALWISDDGDGRSRAAATGCCSPNDPAAAREPGARRSRDQRSARAATGGVWTDDFNNLVQVLK